jgi:hypothetical protein
MTTQPQSPSEQEIDALKPLLEQYGNYCARHYMHNAGIGDLSIDEAREGIEALVAQAADKREQEVRIDELMYWYGRVSKPFGDGDKRLREIRDMMEYCLAELRQGKAAKE